jgi:hypothetical protein
MKTFKSRVNWEYGKSLGNPLQYGTEAAARTVFSDPVGYALVAAIIISKFNDRYKDFFIDL